MRLLLLGGLLLGLEIRVRAIGLLISDPRLLVRLVPHCDVGHFACGTADGVGDLPNGKSATTHTGKDIDQSGCEEGRAQDRTAALSFQLLPSIVTTVSPSTDSQMQW
jgi:hypothetical protein